MRRGSQIRWNAAGLAGWPLDRDAGTVGRSRIILVFTYLIASASVAGLALGGEVAHAQVWTQTSAPITNWFCVASSADGMKLFAGAGGEYSGDAAGLIYRSENGGASWSETAAPVAQWACIASSADGSTLIAAAEGGEGALYLTTNSGAIWVDCTPASVWSLYRNLRAVAITPDGRTLVAANSVQAGYNDASQVFVSTNAGAQWSTTELGEIVESLACSGNGRTIVAGAPSTTYAATYVSTDGGASWVGRYTYAWYDSVGCSVDGNRLVAISGSGSPTGPVYCSTNAGLSWVQITDSDALAFGAALAISAEGDRAAIALGDPNMGLGAVITSCDGEVSWQRTDAPATNWTSIACSADGQRFVACARGSPGGGPIYTARLIPVPVISARLGGDSLLLSWTVPSMPFVLQQSSRPDGGWADMPTTPVLNYLNLRYEVSVPKPAKAVFYRL
jgi:photosystem II stability/assembly factor-like uncharacterized protein